MAALPSPSAPLTLPKLFLFPSPPTYHMAALPSPSAPLALPKPILFPSSSSAQALPPTTHSLTLIAGSYMSTISLQAAKSPASPASISSGTSSQPSCQPRSRTSLARLCGRGNASSWGGHVLSGRRASSCAGRSPALRSAPPAEEDRWEGWRHLPPPCLQPPPPPPPLQRPCVSRLPGNNSLLPLGEAQVWECSLESMRRRLRREEIDNTVN